MKKLCFIPFIFILLSSCDKGIDDASKRNENWCWHVSKTTGKGEWIELGGSNSLPDGWYTMFYSNGNIFEKGKTEDGNQIDTINSFDISGKLTKQTYLVPDSSYEYYMNDGPYKAWNNKGELTEEAIVKDHKVSEQKWYGAFAHFVAVIDICLPSKNAFRAVSKKLAEIISTAAETEAKAISPEDFKYLDSLLNNANKATSRSIEELNKLKELAEMPKYKEDAILLMKAHQIFLTQHIVKSVAILKTGFNDANIEKGQNILIEFANMDKTEQQFSKDATLFQEKFMFDLGQMEYMTERFPDYVIQ